MCHFLDFNLRESHNYDTFQLLNVIMTFIYLFFLLVKQSRVLFSYVAELGFHNYNNYKGVEII